MIIFIVTNNYSISFFLDTNQSVKKAFKSKVLPYHEYVLFTIVAALIKMPLVKNVLMLRSKTKIRF